MGSDGSEGKEGGRGIPSWQRTGTISSSDDASKPTPDSQPRTPALDGDSKDLQDRTPNSTGEDTDAKKEAGRSRPAPTSLLDQARLFLADESIREAPLEQKLAFLRSKGLSKDDIDQVTSMLKDDPTYSQSVTDANAGTASAHRQTRTSHTLPTAAATTPPASSSQTSAAPPARDVPPVITYPEFLVQAQKPPPIITAKRLFNVAWGAAGVAATLYGASKYLITPMSESLASSRHDFISHVQTQLDKFNDKLKDVVSEDPGQKARPTNVTEPAATSKYGDEAVSEADTTESDPTELFHRDFGTQTSPALVADEINGSVYDSSSVDSADADPATAAEQQTSKLRRITEICQSLNSDSADEGTNFAETTTTLKVLNEYLESLSFSGSGLPSNYYFGGSERLTVHDSTGRTGSGTGEDELAKMKSEIRSVKGLFLNARNFPGARQGTFSAPS